MMASCIVQVQAPAFKCEATSKDSDSEWEVVTESASESWMVEECHAASYVAHMEPDELAKAMVESVSGCEERAVELFEAGFRAGASVSSPLRVASFIAAAAEHNKVYVLDIVLEQVRQTIADDVNHGRFGKPAPVIAKAVSNALAATGTSRLCAIVLSNFMSGFENPKKLQPSIPASKTQKTQKSPIKEQRRTMEIALSMPAPSVIDAAKTGRLDEVKRFYQANPKCLEVKYFDSNALYYACLCGHPRVVEYILSKAPYLVRDKNEYERMYMCTGNEATHRALKFWRQQA